MGGRAGGRRGDERKGDEVGEGRRMHVTSSRGLTGRYIDIEIYICTYLHIYTHAHIHTYTHLYTSRYIYLYVGMVYICLYMGNAMLHIGYS